MTCPAHEKGLSLSLSIRRLVLIKPTRTFVLSYQMGSSKLHWTALPYNVFRSGGDGEAPALENDCGGTKGNYVKTNPNKKHVIAFWAHGWVLGKRSNKCYIYIHVPATGAEPLYSTGTPAADVLHLPATLQALKWRWPGGHLTSCTTGLDIRKTQFTIKSFVSGSHNT